MMKDIEIKISRETRMVDLSKTTIGNDGENLQGNLVFSFTDDFVKGQGRLEYIINGESKYVFLLSDDENYYIPIKSVMTKEGQIDMQLVITEGTDASEIPIFKSNVFYVSCKKSINAEVEEEEGYYSWIEIANTKLNEIDEVVEDVETKLANGEFDGKDGKDFTYEDFTKEQLENLRGPQGLPGEPGVDGKDYVLTEADKEEIADNINEENNNRITENEKYISELEATIDILTNTDIKKGELVHITDALPLPTFENKIDGNVKQETTKGYQLLDIEKYYYLESDSKLNGGIVTIENGVIKIDGTNATGRVTAKSKLVAKSSENITILPAGTYYFGINTNGYYENNIDNLKQIKVGVNTLTDNYLLTQWYVDISVGNKIETPLLISNDTNKTTYEPYTNGASPNPEYPQEIEVLEGYNEFDKNNANVIDGYFHGTTPNITSNPDRKIIYIPTKPNTTYTISTPENITSSNMYAVGYTSELPTIGVEVKNINYSSGSVKTITTGEDALYLVVFIYRDGYTLTYEEILDGIQIVKGKEAKLYLPYGCVGYKNVWDNILLPTRGIKTKYFIPKGTIVTAVGETLLTSGNIKFYDIDNNVVWFGLSGDTKYKTMYLDRDIYYIEKASSDSLALYVGNVPNKPYEPYKEQITYLDLKGHWAGKLSDTIRDYLVTDKRKYWLVKNVGKVVLDGNTDINYGTTDSFSNYIVQIDNKDMKKSFNTPLLSNYFTYVYDNWNKDVESICVGGVNYDKIQIKIKLSKLSEATKEGVKAWFSTNNTEVYYPTEETETIYLGELPEPIKTFEGVNNIQLLANIPTEIEVKYALDVKKYYDNKLAEISAQIL